MTTTRRRTRPGYSAGNGDRTSYTPSTPTHALIGVSAAIRRVIDVIETIARTDVRVLITGESGAGKGRCARTLHDRSRRKGRFVPVNCGAVPENLVESELFGHVAGAFSDAKTSREGLIASANGGTLFLDEVTELPRGTQPKLLAVFDHGGEFRRVGSNTLERSYFRLITATNEDIDARVARGEFRRDLRFRIGVVCIYIPPLRERPEDIPLIALHVFHQYRNGDNGGPADISRAALKHLSELEWTGNVRELEQIIELALAFGCDAKILDVGHFRDALQLNSQQQTKTHANSTSARVRPVTLEAARRMGEARAIVDALGETGGHRVKAAERLEIRVSTLYEKLRELQPELKELGFPDGRPPGSRSRMRCGQQ
jgi:DNA-binding NtrC family response regulator